MKICLFLNFCSNVRDQISPEIRKTLFRFNEDELELGLIKEITDFIAKNSPAHEAILIFLPGWQEISNLHKIFINDVRFSDRSKFLLLPLHSMLPTSDAMRVFNRPPNGTRKIVLATNIAETSVRKVEISVTQPRGMEFLRAQLRGMEILGN